MWFCYKIYKKLVLGDLIKFKIYYFFLVNVDLREFYWFLIVSYFWIVNELLNWRWYICIKNIKIIVYSWIVLGLFINLLLYIDCYIGV